MKRRGFLGALLASPLVAKGILMETSRCNGKKNPIKLSPKKGDIRPLPLESRGFSGSDMLVGREESPRYETFNGFEWVKNEA